MENIEFNEFTNQENYKSSTFKKANIETSYKYMQRNFSQQKNMSNILNILSKKN